MSSFTFHNDQASALPVTASAITEHARELVLSGHWRDGLACLRSTAADIGQDAMLDILMGSARLEQAEGSELKVVAEAPDVAASFLADCESAYNRGRLLHDGRRYKARGYVRIASAEIMEEAERRIANGQSRYRQLGREIGVHFMRNKRTEHAAMVLHPASGKSMCVLFEQETNAAERPSWMADLSTDPQRAAESQGVLPNLGMQFDDSDDTLSFAPLSTTATDAGPPRPQQPQAQRDPSKPDAFDKLRQSIAENNAKALGCNNLQELSAHLSERILHALAARGVDEWRVFEMNSPAVGGRRTVSYPVVIAMAYALCNTNSANCAPNWQPVSPPNLKMENDNPLHTDLWLAMGLSLDWTAYGVDHPDNVLFQALVSHLQKSALGYELHILTAASKKSVSGVVRTEADFSNRQAGESTILLAPHAGEEFHALAMASQAVICQQGGKLAHLAIVGREMGIPIVRIDGAMSKFKSGAPVTIDLVNGKVEMGKQT